MTKLRCVRGEEHAGADELLDLAPSAGRRALFEPGGEGRIGDKRSVERRIEIAGRDGVACRPCLAQSVAMPLVRLATAPFVAV